MIIIEGPDCSGKSTLVNTLMSKWNVESTHYNGHHRMSMLEHAVIAPPRIGYIVDRFHLSEIPYSLYHRQTKPDYVGIAMIDRALLARAAVMVICLPPWNIVKAFWSERKRKEMIKSESVLRHIYKWYAGRTYRGIPTIYYDYTKQDVNNLVQHIETLAKARPYSYITAGGPSGRFYDSDVLLVGEKCSKEFQCEVPFTGTNASGPWLTEKLMSHNIYEDDLIWINVKLQDNRDNMNLVIDHIQDYKPQHVIALGSVAHVTLERNHIESIHFDHPQYHKRFQNKEVYPLIPYLKEILDV